MSGDIPYCGIGISGEFFENHAKYGTGFVIFQGVKPGSLAEKGGLENFSVLKEVLVNDQWKTLETFDQAAEFIRGPAGTEVSLRYHKISEPGVLREATVQRDHQISIDLGVDSQRPKFHYQSCGGILVSELQSPNLPQVVSPKEPPTLG